jgi:hypothetical protein
MHGESQVIIGMQMNNGDKLSEHINWDWFTYFFNIRNKRKKIVLSFGEDWHFYFEIFVWLQNFHSNLPPA